MREKEPQINKPEIEKEDQRVPEIIIERNKDIENLHLALCGLDKNWAHQDGELSAEVNEFFEANPLEAIVTDFFEKYRHLDEETLHVVAQAISKPAEASFLTDQIRNNKEKEVDVTAVQQELKQVLDIVGDSISPELQEKIDEFIEADIKDKEQNVDAYKDLIANTIQFFNPKADILDKVAILPSDYLSSKQSGWSSTLSNAVIISSHIENPNNVEHEFMHSFINPIVEKFADQLTDDEKQQIVNSSSRGLKVDQGYGEDWFSLLCESIIRTYTSFSRDTYEKYSVDDFKKRIKAMTEEDFEQKKSTDNTIGRWCEENSIDSFDEFKASLDKYYLDYKSQLADKVFDIYQTFSEQTEDNNFEDFFVKNFKEKLHDGE